MMDLGTQLKWQNFFGQDPLLSTLPLTTPHGKLLLSKLSSKRANQQATAIQQAAQRAIQQAGQRAIQQAAQRATQKAAQRAAQQAARASQQAAQRATQHVAQQVTQHVAQQVTQQVTQQVAQQVTQQVAQQVTQQVAQQVTQQVAQQVTQQVARQVTQQAAQQVTQQVTQQVAQQVTQVTQQAAQQVAQQVTQVTQQAAQQVTQQAAQQITQQAAQQVTQQAAQQVTQQQVTQQAVRQAAQQIKGFITVKNGIIVASVLALGCVWWWQRQKLQKTPKELLSSWYELTGTRDDTFPWQEYRGRSLPIVFLKKMHEIVSTEKSVISREGLERGLNIYGSLPGMIEGIKRDWLAEYEGISLIDLFHPRLGSFECQLHLQETGDFLFRYSLLQEQFVLSYLGESRVQNIFLDWCKEENRWNKETSQSAGSLPDILAKYSHFLKRPRHCPEVYSR